eukprot:TRINITY_DN18546_c0_g1_i3.p1 TRINITY_DN18546_c0_g1~~TRINITY_DN18546_c0_g1_i3.p1  ORF type:complete len:266 (+),score=67.49 TRINITY_DN18546_c0_g1_i3:184-981(+)
MCIRDRSSYAMLLEGVLGTHAEVLGLSESSWHRAVSIAWYQSLQVEMESGGTQRAVIPHLQAAKRGVHSSAKLVEKDGMVALWGKLESAEHLEVDAGSNFDLLLNRGEVSTNAQHSRVFVRGYPDEGQFFGAAKIKMLKALGIGPAHNYWISLHQIDPRLLLALRIDALTPTLPWFGKAQRGEFVSAKNELAALRLFLQICEHTIKMYGSTLQDDMALPEETLVAGSAERRAVLHRRNEKYVLQSCPKLARLHWRELLFADGRAL